MTPRMKGTWILAGLGVLTVIAGDGRDAQAAGTKAIVITGGYKPATSDPLYDYIFQVSLEPTAGPNSLFTGDSFTIGAVPRKGVSTPLTPLPGVTLSSPTSVLSSYSWSPLITEINTSPPFSSVVTWTYTGASTITATTGPVYLGQFSVETTYDFQNGPPLPAGSRIAYSFNFNGGSFDESSFQLSSLPEPSSVILLLVGAGTLPLYWLRERRRRRSSSR